MIPLFEARGLTASVGDITAVRGLDLGLRAGQVLAILGRNGVGKSTLLATLAGLRPAAAGQVLIEGSPVAAMAPRQLAQVRAYLPQHVHDPFASTVLETAMIGRHPHLGRWDWESAADHRLALDALAAVELNGLEEREVHTLSGGERQRLGLAMLLVQSPRLYLLDEPLAHLDPHHGLAALQLLRTQATTTGAAVIVVLHDANLALRYCDAALLLFGDGECSHGPAEDVIDGASLTRLYGHPLRRIDDAGRPWYVPAT